MKASDPYPDQGESQSARAAPAEAIVGGLAAEIANLLPGKGSLARESSRQIDLAAALQELEGDLNAVEIRLAGAVEGNLLVLVLRRDFIRLGLALLGRGAGPDDALTPEVMSASLGLFHKAAERTAHEIERRTGRAVRCAAPELINPAGNREGIVPLAAAYENALGLRCRLALEPSAAFPLELLIQQRLLDSAERAAAAAGSAARPAAHSAERPQTGADHGAHQWNMDLILDVELGVIVSFGETRMPLRDVLKLGVGSVIELDKGVNDPVTVIVNDKPIATGEVVMVDGNYGVKILEVESTADRIRSLA